MSLGSRPTFLPHGILIHQAIWPQQLWAENWGQAVPLWGRGAGSPSNTIWPGPRPTSCQVSSRSIRLFGQNTPTLQTDRQRSDSVVQTVLQTVTHRCVVTMCVCVCRRIRCTVEKVVPCGAASIVRCNGINQVAPAAVVIDDDDDDDVICLDDDPPSKPNCSRLYAGCVPYCRNY